VTQWLYVLVAVLIGLGAAVQSSMLGALGRERGATEAGWISLLGSLTAIGTILAIRTLRGDTVALPAPFDRVTVQVALAVVAVACLALSLRGVAPYYGIAGVFGVAFIVGAAFMVPRIGVALFFGAATAGTVMGALAVDHIGAFGAEPQHATLVRILGLGLLLLGVVVVRSG
jgi:uncharacterized membrane protein YdcZ (DUF606 family)